MIQVPGERVLSENRLDIKRQSDKRKQQVNSVKRVQKIAQEGQKGRQNRQNTARGTRKRTRKGTSKKGSIQRGATREGNAKQLPEKKTEKRSSTKRIELQRIPERRGAKSCPIWVFSYAKTQKKLKIFIFFSTNRLLILASVFNSTDHVSVKH